MFIGEKKIPCCKNHQSCYYQENPKHRRRYLREVKTFVVNEAKWKAAEEFCENKGFQWQIMTEDTLSNTK